MDIVSQQKADGYEWVDFFNNLSEVFLTFENEQPALIEILKKAGISNGFEDQIKKGVKTPLQKIDPFSAWSLILKHGPARRSEILENINTILSIKREAPKTFKGIPSVNGTQAWFFPYAYEREKDHISQLWRLFKQAFNGQVDGGLFDRLLEYKILAISKLTSGLFVANPSVYLPLNSQTMTIVEGLGFNEKAHNFAEYLKVLGGLSDAHPNKPVYEISSEAFTANNIVDTLDPEYPLEVEDASVYLNSSTSLDNDAETTEDLLNRKEFASYLAGEINDLMSRSSESSTDKSSIFNIYGAWGSGKSTFVKMLKGELKAPTRENHKDKDEDNQEWLTVDFNAWRNQHIKPVWWSLLDHVTTQLNNQETGFFRKPWLKIKEWCWRINAAYGFWLLIPTILLAIIFILGIEGLALKDWKTVGGIVTSAVAIMGIGVAVLQSLFSGTGVAKLFQTLHRDPYEYVIQHYKKTLKNHKNKSVFIFIDDLDRCSATYVVELLECLHTFFSTRQVFIMVAADRTWISSCFEEVYDGKGSSANEVGRPRGYLFLEKIFQVSIGLPVVTDRIKGRFVSSLLGDKSEKTRIKFKHPSRETIANFLQEATTEEQLTEKGKDLQSQGYTPEDVAAVATKISGTKAFGEARKHRLARFLPLMDANPRNIKLLINVYGIYINLFRMGGRVELTTEVLDQIALWSILNIRYPRLAEFIEGDIYSLDVINQYYEKPKQVGIEGGLLVLPEDIQNIVRNKDVKRVIKGDYIPTVDNKSMIFGLNKTTLGELIGAEERFI
jgi:energy-coupling factor transporter ATP-binding protein EcfA2